MSSTDEMVSFMDLLDLDEDIIDARLKSIMLKSSHTSKQLASALNLLQYKHLLNLKEGTECDNEKECDFVAKLINEVHDENVDYVCKIASTALQLSTSTIVSKSEHLFQQIIGSENPQANGMSGDTIAGTNPSMLLRFKLCEAILDAVMIKGQKLRLHFLEIPLQNLLSSKDEKLKIHFLTNTVPRLFRGIVGYHILDNIFLCLKGMKMRGNEANILKCLSCLSEFYLPVPDSKGMIKCMSDMVFKYEFWNAILHGLRSSDPGMRKMSVYLAKRAIDCLIAFNTDASVKSELETIFSWRQKHQTSLKTTWDTFFILIDSLEEKQSNIVLPSLQLFDKLGGIEQCWINCAFSIGLKHENAQVRLKCVDYKIKNKLNSELEAMLLLEALNDINLYDNPKDSKQLITNISTVLEEVDTFLYILKATPKLKWSPVPLFYITKALSSVKQKKILSAMEPAQLTQTVIDILKIPCNNVVVRKAVKLNVAYILMNSCRSIEWKELVKIYSAINWNTLNLEKNFYNPFTSLIKHLYLSQDEKQIFFELIISSYQNIDFGLAYLESHDNDMTLFLEVICKKIQKVRDVINRQYSDKTECFDQFIFLTHLFDKTSKRDSASKQFINEIISREHKLFVQYIACILSSNLNLAQEERALVFRGFSSIATVDRPDSNESLLQLYKSALLMLNDKNSDLHTKVNAVYILNSLKCNTGLTLNHRNEMLDLKKALNMTLEMKFKDTQNMDNDGRLRNLIYEKLSEMIFQSLKEDQINAKGSINELLKYIDKVIECGGYGCLKWTLKIVNEILPFVINEGIEFDALQFIDKMWKEIEELKSNNQYTPCIKEFINLITNNALLKKAMYNNIVILYCSKIIEYGPLKNTPLFYLARKLNSIEITEDMGNLIYVLSEILLYAPVPRKDQRIADNTVINILQDRSYSFTKLDSDIHFNYEIQMLSVSTLCKISKQDILETIFSFIINKLEETFSNKLRYHGHSQLHRTLLISLQHLMIILLLNPKIVESEKYLKWTLDFFGRMPHQPSVRICLEWCIALHFYIKKIGLNDEIIDMLNVHNIPVISQFMLLYWTLKHKMAIRNYKNVEYECAMDFLLSHTMGQLFTNRLHAQFLATNLFEINTQNYDKYAYIVEVIHKTFVESSKDKNFVKLKQDFFINDFDIVSHLTPCFIYHFLPRYCDISNNENVDEVFIKNILKEINESILKNINNREFTEEWISLCKKDDQVFEYNLNTRTEQNEVLQTSEAAGTIQKKYVPWKSMSDMDIYQSGKMKERSSELIVVASLIDKLPNLGGMARTSEIFGVNTYVIDSLRHLQDRIFQGLSVSAERWVNVEEVRAGAPLKQYLMGKKAEGYSVVAAEQTSTSEKLQKFKFPKKTLLLLGHEKEGIPCDMLPMMDHCVEIPQQGVVRSLNVHVTAAIFVWEYTRQNLL